MALQGWLQATPSHAGVELLLFELLFQKEAPWRKGSSSEITLAVPSIPPVYRPSLEDLWRQARSLLGLLLAPGSGEVSGAVAGTGVTAGLQGLLLAEGVISGEVLPLLGLLVPDWPGM